MAVSPSDTPNYTLTIRLIMQGKEVGSIIGKKGDIVKKFREESGAKINISDGACPERIVSITGNKDNIYKAFTLICNKFEEDLNSLLSPGTVPRPPISFRLVVPASQCGSLIGKGGSKIKEIREVTGASVQVASEMLPNSTERTVTVSGGSEAVIQSIYHICCIMSESPPKGVTVPYTPLKSLAVPGVTNIQTLVQPSQALVPSNPITNQVQAPGKVGIPVSLGSPAAAAQAAAAAAAAGMNGAAQAAAAAGLLNPAALALLTAGGTVRPPAAPHQTHEMTVPNELIGCIIGKGGSKVAEIRQLSGAMIRISNCEDRDAPANLDRTITISGNCESVALAQYLINMSMEVFRANLALAEEAEKAVHHGHHQHHQHQHQQQQQHSHQQQQQAAVAAAAAAACFQQQQQNITPPPPPAGQQQAQHHNPPHAHIPHHSPATTHAAYHHQPPITQYQIFAPQPAAVTAAAAAAAAAANGGGEQPTAVVPAASGTPQGPQYSAVEQSIFSPLLRLPTYDQLILPPKLKASASLISIPSIRDQKFAPY